MKKIPQKNSLLYEKYKTKYQNMYCLEDEEEYILSQMYSEIYRESKSEREFLKRVITEDFPEEIYMKKRIYDNIKSLWNVIDKGKTEKIILMQDNFFEHKPTEVSKIRTYKDDKYSAIEYSYNNDKILIKFSNKSISIYKNPIKGNLLSCIPETIFMYDEKNKENFLKYEQKDLYYCAVLFDLFLEYEY